MSAGKDARAWVGGVLRARVALGEWHALRLARALARIGPRSMWSALLFLAAGFVAQTPNAPPESAPSNSLARARATFRALDRDADGKLSNVEIGTYLERLPGGGAKCDTNGDGQFSRDEFVLAYRAFLRAQGQLAAADLDVEAARIEALRRTASAPGATRSGLNPGAAPFAGRGGAPTRVARDAATPAGVPGGAPNVDPRRIRADAACDDLLRALATGIVSLREFERLRVLLVLDADEARAFTAFGFRACVAGLSRGDSAELELRLRTWYDQLWTRGTKTARQVSPASPPLSR